MKPALFSAALNAHAAGTAPRKGQPPVVARADHTARINPHPSYPINSPTTRIALKTADSNPEFSV